LVTLYPRHFFFEVINFHLIASEITTQIVKPQEFCLWWWNHSPPII